MKYKEGDFGYWWNVELGNSDIEGQVYNGNINCSYQNLTSLKGAPKEVNGYFWCFDNKLTSLEFCPRKINGYFDCDNNKLTSLQFCPKVVNDVFYCFNNKIKNKNEFKKIKFCKDISSDFDNTEIMDLIKQNSPEYYI